MERINLATLAVLVAGAIATAAGLVYAGEGASSLLSGFTIWALLPYAVLLWARSLASSRGRAIVALMVTILVVGFAVVLDADALFFHRRSTGGLVIVIVPLYQLAAASLLLVGLFFAQKPRPAGSS